MKALTSSTPWVQFVSVCVFLFYALTLSIPSGYSYGSSLLLLGSLALLVRRPGWQLSGEDKAIAYTLLAVFLVALLTFFLQGNKGKTLDQASRCLLVIPVLLLLLKAPPRLSYVWAGLALGSVAAAGLALWQVHVLGYPRAEGFVTTAIPFGDLGLQMGVLCATGLFWTGTQKSHVWQWRIALAAGMLGGIYCVIASETRGAIVAVPFLVMLFGLAFISRKNLVRTAAGLLVLLVALTAIMFSEAGTGLAARSQLAVAGLDNYMHSRTVGTDVGVRLEAWRAAVISVPEKPWLGWSYKDYDAHLRDLVAQKTVDPVVTKLANTHNNYLEVLLHQGILGLVTLLALFVLPFWFFCRRLRAADMTTRVLALSGASLIVSFGVFALTHVILGRNNGIVFFLMTLLVFWGCMRGREKAVD